MIEPRSPAFGHPLFAILSRKITTKLIIKDFGDSVLKFTEDRNRLITQPCNYMRK